MGVSWSNGNRRRYNNYPVNPGPSQPAAATATAFYTSDPPSFSSSAPPNYVLAANSPFTPPPPPYPCQPPYPAPPPPPHQSYYQYNTSGYTGGPIMGRLDYQPRRPPPPGRWHTIPPPSVAAPPPPLLPLVEQHEAKKIRNAVNVHKDTITLQLDDANPDCHLLSFTFDALVDGSITIFYFGKEGVDCTFTSLYPEAHVPVKVPFEKGLRQKFRQPSGTGFDLGFFELDDLLKPSPGEDVFPLVIYAEACSSLPPTSEQLHQTLPTTSHAQITQAIIQKNNGGTFQVKVIKQILWVDRVRYELREIYGIGTSAETSFDDSDLGKECVICMSVPKDTAVLPCRHMCMCSECAKELKLQTNKCPICRQPIEELIEIKVNKSD